jgi:hypothetical protein
MLLKTRKMATVDLVFDAKSYPVPKDSISNLLHHHQSLLDAPNYAVRCCVPLDIFESFIESLKTESKISATDENAAPLSLLAKEFLLPDLESECAAFPVSLGQFASLSERVCRLEKQMSSLSSGTHNCEDVTTPQTDVQTLNSLLSDEPALKQCEIPMAEAESLEGILSYLTRTHGGNFYEKGIVTITSKSVYSAAPRYALKNVADFTDGSTFVSADQPGQWVCWDFHDLHIRPTHYTIWTALLKSWVVEGSLDGRNWTAIDRQTDNRAFETENTVSFAVSNPAECRFIRLTQTGKTYAQVACLDSLTLSAVEFFGALIETLPYRISVIENVLEMAALKLRIEMKEAKSLDGIISHLAKKHGGNVHEKGIVTLTAKSEYQDGSWCPLKTIVQVASSGAQTPAFQTEDAPGQWVCWDFGERRVRPTHYTIRGLWLKSWVVDGSADGVNWQELHREKDNRTFKQGPRSETASFAVSGSAKCRFIRLAQTGKNSSRGDMLLCAPSSILGPSMSKSALLDLFSNRRESGLLAGRFIITNFVMVCDTFGLQKPNLRQDCASSLREETEPFVLN